MMPTEHPSIIEILRSTLEEISSLHNLLQQESQALSNGRSDEIESIAQYKHESVLRIDDLAKLQNHFLESKQLPGGEKGLDRFLVNFSNDDPNVNEIQDYRKKINQNLVHCKALNDRNGASIELLNRHTLRAIDILRNRTHHPYTYGPDGSRQQSQISRARVSV